MLHTCKTASGDERKERDCHMSPKFAVVQNPISLYSFMHLTVKIRLQIFLRYSLWDTLLQ